MDIPVASAVGRGGTQLAAFDAALVSAGIADRNLIYLSSVLPPGSRVLRTNRVFATPGAWGDRLYCVMAEARTATLGEQVWAGIGWVHDESGRGLLVEHHAHDEAEVRDLIDTSLDGLQRNRGRTFPHRQAEIVGATCTNDPVCALVVAVFESAPWTSAGAARAPARSSGLVPVTLS